MNVFFQLASIGFSLRTCVTSRHTNKHNAETKHKSLFPKQDEKGHLLFIIILFLFLFFLQV